MAAKSALLLPELRGDRLRASYSFGVSSLMGTDAPPVLSRGGDFFHRARWTRRILVDVMCKWAKANPGCCPTRNDVANWVHQVNTSGHVEPLIQIAATPERVTRRLALALIGGAYHEALHGLMSCKRNLRVDEIADLIIPRWAKVPDWSKLTRLLLDWSNIVEDVRIERRGIEEFPGISVKMHDLQDFILNKESLSRAEATAAGHHEATKRTLTIVSGVFRDVGLGYNTNSQRLAMSTYRTLNPEAVKLVLDGPISPFLREAITLPVADEMGALRIAMDVLAELSQIGEADGEDQQEGQSGKPACPSCGAPGSKLKVRPMSDGNGGKVKGKGVLTCTACGHQEIVDLDESEGGQSGPPPDPEDAVQYEDIPQDSPEDDEGEEGEDGEGDGEGEPGDDDSEPQDGKGGSGDPEDGDDEDADSKGKGGKGEASEGDDEGDDAEGEGSDDSEDGEDDAEGKGKGEGDEDGDDEGDSDSEGDEDGEGDGDERRDNLDQTASDDAKHEQEGESGDDGDGDPSPNSNPQGGGHDDSGEDWKAIADSILDDADEGAGIMDASSALADSFNDELGTEDDACGRDESPWRPLDASLDDVHFVRPSDKASAKSKSDTMLKSVKRESAFLRARLRNIVLALEQTDTEHGLRRGKGLSQRMLVDSKCAIMGGSMPDRAYYDTTDKVDTSLAAAVVIDESGSMNSILRDATRVMMAITEPLDALGCAVQVSGFRNGRYGNHYGSTADAGNVQYHRYNGVRHDVFKAFDEKFSVAKHRFSCTQATGGTPMADGVKFGLDGLNDREEAHRILFVVTDGCPDGGHMPVIKRLIRIANDAGIHVVGVGLGYGAEYVKNVFPDYVYTDDIKDMPKALVRKLNELLDFTGSKRGRKMRKVS